VFASLRDVNFGAGRSWSSIACRNAGRTPKEAAEVNKRYLVETMHQTL